MVASFKQKLPWIVAGLVIGLVGFYSGAFDVIGRLIVKSATGTEFVEIRLPFDQPGKIYVPAQAIKSGKNGDGIFFMLRGPMQKAKDYTVKVHIVESHDGWAEVAAPETVVPPDNNNFVPFELQPGDRAVVTNR